MVHGQLQHLWVYFNQAYNFFFHFPADNIWGRSGLWDESFFVPLHEKSSKPAVTKLNSPGYCCQAVMLSLNLALFAGKKDGHQLITCQTTAVHTIAPQVPKFLFSSWTSSYLYVSFLQSMAIMWMQCRSRWEFLPKVAVCSKHCMLLMCHGVQGI